MKGEIIYVFREKKVKGSGEKISNYYVRYLLFTKKEKNHTHAFYK